MEAKPSQSTKVTTGIAKASANRTIRATFALEAASKAPPFGHGNRHRLAGDACKSGYRILAYLCLEFHEAAAVHRLADGACVRIRLGGIGHRSSGNVIERQKGDNLLDLSHRLVKGFGLHRNDALGLVLFVCNQEQIALGRLHHHIRVRRDQGESAPQGPAMREIWGTTPERLLLHMSSSPMAASASTPSLR